MADPILAKISELDELTSTDGADQLLIVDASEPNVTKKTKRARMDKLKLTTVAQIADGIVTSSKLAAGAVTAGKIATGGVSAAAQIADGIVTDVKLASNSVTESKIASAAVTSGKIANGAVTSTKIADSAVTSGKIANGAVTSTKIADSAVTSGKIANGGVSSAAQIADGIVTEHKLAINAVTSAKLANAAVTDEKLASIDKTLLVRLLAVDELTSLRTWLNEFLWTPVLDGLVIKEAYATLSYPTASGNVVVTVKNDNDIVTTLTVSPNSFYSPAGSINSSYRTVTKFHRVSFQITSAGTGAKGLSVILVVGRAV